MVPCTLMGRSARRIAGWWSDFAGVAVGMATLCLVGGYGRRIARKNEPFYGRSYFDRRNYVWSFGQCNSSFLFTVGQQFANRLGSCDFLGPVNNAVFRLQTRPD